MTLASGLSPADILDIAVACVVAVSLVIGIVKGFSGAVAHINALLAAFVANRLLGPPWKALCSQWFPPSSFLCVSVSLVGSILATVVVGWLVWRLTDRCIRVLVPQPANAILGGVLSSLAAAGIMYIVCFALSQLPNPFVHDSLLRPSRFWQFAAPVASTLQAGK